MSVIWLNAKPPANMVPLEAQCATARGNFQLQLILTPIKPRSHIDCLSKCHPSCHESLFLCPVLTSTRPNSQDLAPSTLWRSFDRCASLVGCIDSTTKLFLLCYPLALSGSYILRQADAFRLTTHLHENVHSLKAKRPRFLLRRYWVEQESGAERSESQSEREE